MNPESRKRVETVVTAVCVAAIGLILLVGFLNDSGIVYGLIVPIMAFMWIWGQMSKRSARRDQER